MDKRTEAPIDLDYPIEFDGEKITSLKMRRPKVRDSLKQNRLKSNEFEKGLSLIADLVERPVELLEELDEVDLEKLQKQYMAFTGRQGDTTPKA